MAIVSEGFARRFLPNQEAVGKRIKRSGPGSGNPWMEIVGVVGNVKYLGLTVDTDPAYYMPFAQTYGAADVSGGAHVGRRRTPGGGASPGHSIHRPGRDAGADRHHGSRRCSLSVSQPRFDTMLLALFAGIALLLAAVGIYGLIAYSVAQRTHEIGVRMALGAAQADVVRMVVRQGAALAAIGIVLGLAGAFALTRLLTMLFGIGVTDALTFAAAPLGLMLVVLLATLLPALRATRISPVVALRYE